MEIDKDFLTTELAGLSTQKRQILAKADMCEGAIQVLKQLIQRLDASEPEESPEIIGVASKE